MTNRLKVAVIGCGAMGSIYAALLADAGHVVSVVDAWAAHIDAIGRHGLRVEGASGDRTVRVAATIDVPAGPFDLIVVAVKAVGVEAVAPRLASLMKSNTLVLTIQNGVGSAATLAGHVPPDRLAVGIASGFGAIVRGLGHVHHDAMNALRFGAAHGLPIAEVEQLAAVWREAGFQAEAVRNVVAMQWEKLICNAAYSGPCGVTGMTVGEMMDDPDMGPISRAAATEAWAVAEALGVGVRVDDPIRLVRDFAASMPGAKPSVLQDLEKNRRSEIDVINGAVVRGGRKLNVATPTNEALVALVKWRERSFA